MYLILSISEDYRSITAPSSIQREPFHLLLQVDPYENSKRVLRNGFHKAGLRLHPDKIGPRGEEAFFRLRAAYDILRSKTKSWTYRRLGTDLIDTPAYKDCFSTQDFVHVAMDSILRQSGAMALGLLVSAKRGSRLRVSALASLENIGLNRPPCKQS